jgi:hypothetical protein
MNFLGRGYVFVTINQNLRLPEEQLFKKARKCREKNDIQAAVVHIEELFKKFADSFWLKKHRRRVMIGVDRNLFDQSNSY